MSVEKLFKAEIQNVKQQQREVEEAGGEGGAEGAGCGRSRKAGLTPGSSASGRSHQRKL